MNLFDDAAGGLERLASGAEHLAGEVVNDGAQLVSDGVDAVGLDGAASDVSKWGEQAADALGDAVSETQLGQTTDPKELIHGEVSALYKTVEGFGKFATAFAETAHGLSGLDSSHWQGQAADAFRAKADPQPKKWQDAYEACNSAADALTSYAQTVASAQDQAQQAIELYAQGEQATTQAKAAYQQKVEEYNRTADAYNHAVAAGQNPGTPPTQPAAFTDPGDGLRQQAEELLQRARQQRDSAGEQAASAIRSMTELAPAEPSFGQRLLNDLGDVQQGSTVAAEHLVGGIVKGAAGIVDFGRSLNPVDLYNVTHPAEYIEGLSTTAAGLVHMSLHPTSVVPALVGTGWGSDPFEAFGKLVPTAVLAVATDGAGAVEGAAVDAGEIAAEDGAEARARDLAGAAEDTARTPKDTVCEDDPVDVASGAVLLPQVDIDLPGALALVVARTHLSRYRLGRWFGPSWASTLDQRIIVDADGALFVSADGLVLHYPHPGADHPVLPEAGARWPLAAHPGGGYTVTNPISGQTSYFARRTGAGTWVLTAIADRAGHRLSVLYDHDGAPAEIHHHGGYRVRVSTESGRVTVLHLINGGGKDRADPDAGDVELVRYAYTDGQLTEVINSSGLPMRFSYDHAGRMTGWIDRNDVWYRYTYDGQGRCIRTESRDGALSGTFDYEPEQRVTVHTDGLGASTRYEYNEQHRVTATMDALGNVTRREYDPWGNLLAAIDPLGRVSRWEYDEAGNPLRITRPDHTQTVVEYNDLHLPTVLVEPDGAVWRYTYDERGNRTTAADPLGNTTTYRYDERGHLAAITDPTGRTTTIGTDAAGLPVAITDPAGGSVRFRRDGFGRVIEQTDAAGEVTRYGWTVEGKLAWRSNPDGATERWSYDPEGNEIEFVDAANQVTRTEYTHFDLRSAVTGPDGGRLEYRYDPQLRLASITNPQGLVWRYEYDPAGTLIAETDFNGRILRYMHDAAGQVIERVNGAGQTIRYSYDAVGNIIAEHAGTETTRFAYDPAGRLVHAADPDCDLALHRDPLGRVVAETVNGRTLTSSYDPAGRRMRRSTPGGVESVWEYGTAGHPAALHTAGQTITYTYDHAGREVERRLGEAFLLAQTWDPTGRLATQTLVGGQLHPSLSYAGPAAPSSGLRMLQRRAYTYRPDGYVTGVDDQLSGRRHFDLDPLGQVTAVTRPQGRERYGYDRSGNLTHAAWPASPAMAHTDAIGARDYAGTLIRAAGNVRYQHDPQGRLVVREQRRLSSKNWIWRYIWDAHDRLTLVITPDGTHWRYRYDPLGRRIAKQRLSPDQATVVEQIDFTWDGSNFVEETHDNIHTTTWDYQAGSHVPITQVERSLSFGPDHADQDWYDQRFYAIVTDLVGMPTELVDPEGTLAWHHQTTLWGAALARLTSHASTPLRFPGQYFDPETGLHYNHHRYYDPATGRYTSHDPLGVVPAPNPVAYVHNPLTWADPLGLAKCDVHVSQPYRDWGNKGAHLHIDNAEVRVYPDGNGGIGAEGIRLSNGNVPTPKQVQQVLDALHNDPGLRAELIQKTRAAMNDMNAGAYGTTKNKAIEMNFLIKALEKMG